MLLRKQIGAGTPRGLQAQVLQTMLLVFGLVNATKQLIGEIVGTFLENTGCRPRSLVADRNPFPVKFRYFHHGLLA